MELSMLKRQQLNIYDNKKNQALDKYKIEDEDEIYVLFFFIAYFYPH